MANRNFVKANIATFNNDGIIEEKTKWYEYNATNADHEKELEKIREMAKKEFNAFSVTVY